MSCLAGSPVSSYDLASSVLADHHPIHHLLQCKIHLSEMGALATLHQLYVLWQPRWALSLFLAHCEPINALCNAQQLPSGASPAFPMVGLA